MNTKYKILAILFLISFSSCKKWLEVQPKTEIASDVNFKDEQGFKDALTGAYLNMTDPAVYGTELSFGFIDVLAQQYTQFDASSAYIEDSKYNYLSQATRTRIDNIWTGNYHTIANLNNLIENLEKADRNLFSDNNYEVIKGEAYGLRAFNHFDLLRLFAPAPSASGLNALAIPYRDKFESKLTKQLTIAEVLNKITDDLNMAAELLKNNDPIVSESAVPPTTTGYLRDRQLKFNYYAVKALLARVYLYAGDTEKALANATELIDSHKFPPTPVNKIIAGDRVFSTEVIFNIYTNVLSSGLYDQYFTSNSRLTKSVAEYATVYETSKYGSSDYRYLYQTENRGTIQLLTKLSPQANTLAPNRLPLIRLSEMYYIAAECLKSTDPKKAIDYLNEIRLTRNLSSLPQDLNAEDIQNEIFKEYRKDFNCEGQLFYYYKRLNLNKIEFSQVTANNSVYVLPIPDNEIEFGAIN